MLEESRPVNLNLQLDWRKKLNESIQKGFNFNTNWNSVVQKHLDPIFEKFSIQTILEIGSFEGQSACYFSKKITNGEIHCLDTWKGDEDLREKKMDFNIIERNFDKNIKLANEINPSVNFLKYKNESYKQLSKFIAQGKENFFDLIYIDGAHDSQNVLFDAVTSFKLVKEGGIIVFDDYLWENKDKNIINSPKFAIDSFVNIFSNKIYVIRHFLYQLYVVKISN
tara:strand:- start:4956 stop:5627 length:672 start_codon:yes stop_codon:yes gene_type:complete